MKKALILIVAGGLCFWLGRLSVPVPSVCPEVRVLTLRDTVVVREPVVVATRIIQEKSVRLPSDSVQTVSGDSVDVRLPFESREYSGEGYRAFVSGFRPALDSIVLFRNTTAISLCGHSVSDRHQKEKRFSVGLQAGCGLTPAGVQPYVGLGITFRIFSF